MLNGNPNNESLTQAVLCLHVLLSNACVTASYSWDPRPNSHVKHPMTSGRPVSLHTSDILKQVGNSNKHPPAPKPHAAEKVYFTSSYDYLSAPWQQHVLIR